MHRFSPLPFYSGINSLIPESLAMIKISQQNCPFDSVRQIQIKRKGLASCGTNHAGYQNAVNRLNGYGLVALVRVLHHMAADAIDDAHKGDRHKL